jgi:hypothetical protein
MPYYPPDTPPEPPGQMPQASTPGPAPVPYAGGTDQRPEPPLYAVPGVSTGLALDAGVLVGVTGANHVTSSPLAAPNPNPYEAGSVSPVMFPGDADPGGRDIVSGTVAGAVAAAQARFGELAGDTYTQGSHVGDLMKLPPGPLDPGVGSLGETLPAGHYYTPPRDYGDEPA